MYVGASEASAPAGGSFPAAASLISYYKCDDTLTVGGFIVDSVAGGVNLQQQSWGNPQTMTGIIGNALDTRGSDDGGSQWLSPSLNTHWIVTGHSWTLRYWVYPTSEAGGADLCDTTVKGHFVWDTGYDGGDQFFFKFNHGTFCNTTTLTSAPGYAINQWHRVIIWHDLGTQYGLQVDNDTPVTSSQSEDICNELDVDYDFNIIDSYLGMDEIALWRDHVLTSGERLADWNGGAGVTYTP